MTAGPVSYAVDASRSSEMAAWLKCNDVDTRDVPYPSRVSVETADGTDWVIRYDTYVRTATGTIKFDHVTETFEYVEALAALVTDPPMWWLKETAPSAVQGTERAVELPKSPSGSEDNVSDGVCSLD